MMKTTQQTPNRASKDTLARLLASENITVQHQPVPTACFDVLNRTLILPIWKDMSDDVYDMLVMHEVGHALYTPAGEEALMDAINSIDAKNPGAVKQYLNICEDPRIEMLIKKKFPGGRRQFAIAYTDLWERGFFDCTESEIKTKGFGDRANLYFKVGFLMADGTIPFNDMEQDIIDAIEDATTWDEMVDCARRMYDLVPKTGTPENNDQDGDSGVPSDDQDGAEGESSANMPGGDDQDGESQSESDSDGNSDGNGSSGEDSGQSLEDETDDGESADSTKGQSGDDSTSPEGEDDGSTPGDSTNSDGNAGEPGQQGGIEANTTPAAEDLTTSNAFNKAMEQAADLTAGERFYGTMPKTLNHDHLIIDYKEVHKAFMQGVVWNQDEVARMAKEFMNGTRQTVNTMVKQFEALMAADVDRRTAIGRSGILDPNRLHSYTITEDIFLRRETTAEGKNHGIVMFMDWSGSMDTVLPDVVKQVINLCLFCQKVNIPFEVYSFTSNIWTGTHNRLYDLTDEQRAAIDNAPAATCEPGDINISCSSYSRNFQIHNWMSSRMNTREFNQAVNNLFSFTINRWDNRDLVMSIPGAFDLGSTPLNEALLTAQYLIPEFQKANNLQIVNTVILTDGEASGTPQQVMQADGTMKNVSYGDHLFVTSRKTKKSYDMTRGQTTNNLINMLKSETGCNVIGMFLIAGSNPSNQRTIEMTISRHRTDEDYDWSAVEKMTSEAFAEFKKNNGCVVPHPAYTEFYILRGNTKVVDGNILDELDESASITKVRNAFIKNNSNKQSSRTILARLAGVVARDLKA